MDPLTTALISLAIVASASYALKGYLVYQDIMRVVQGRFGRKAWAHNREDVLLRAFLWIVPAKWYYRKEDTWVEYAEGLRKGGPQ